MNCIVTGGAGFIGSRLVRRLVDEGHDVFVIDNLSGGYREEIDFVPDSRFFMASVTDEVAVDIVFKVAKPDWVFHLAALPRVQYSVAYPVKTNESNITGSVVMLEQARKHKVKKFVYSSSSSAYGNQDTLPLTEDMCANPLSPYALQKFAGELYAVQYAEIMGLPTVSLRYFNVYGPTQRADSAYAAAIPKFTLQALKNEPVTVFGDGFQTRDFTYVEDVVNANILAAESKDHSNGNVYNVGCNNQVSVNGIIDRIKTALDRDFIVDHLPPVVESRHTRADITRTTRDLGWTPNTDFSDGLVKTVEGVRKRYGI